MATSIKVLTLKVQSVYTYKKVNIPSKVFFKGEKTPKLWYHLKRDESTIQLEGKYVPSATYETVKSQIFNNIPIRGIEKKLIASRATLDLSMEEIKQFIDGIRIISNRKEEE